MWYLQIEASSTFMVGGAFFLVLWLGYGVRYLQENHMTMDLHTVGYLIIALIYLIFAIKK
jgi:hypothetical protein